VLLCGLRHSNSTTVTPTGGGADHGEVRAGNERIQSPPHPAPEIYISHTRSKIKIGSLAVCRCEDTDLLEWASTCLHEKPESLPRVVVDTRAVVEGMTGKLLFPRGTSKYLTHWTLLVDRITLVSEIGYANH